MCDSVRHGLLSGFLPRVHLAEHIGGAVQCLLLGGMRTSHGHRNPVANDPERKCCISKTRSLCADLLLTAANGEDRHKAVLEVSSLPANVGIATGNAGRPRHTRQLSKPSQKSWTIRLIYLYGYGSLSGSLAYSLKVLKTDDRHLRICPRLI